jgi:hypothetical protein
VELELEAVHQTMVMAEQELQTLAVVAVAQEELHQLYLVVRAVVLVDILIC